MVPTDYTDRHNQVASIIHWSICRHFQVPVESRWYRHQPDRLVETDDIVVMWDTIIPLRGRSKPTNRTSVAETRRLTPLISAVLPMATSVGSMLRSWQSMATCGWRSAACGNVGPRWFPLYWELWAQCTQVLHGGWTLFQVPQPAAFTESSALGIRSDST